MTVPVLPREGDRVHAGPSGCGSHRFDGLDPRPIAADPSWTAHEANGSEPKPGAVARLRLSAGHSPTRALPAVEDLPGLGESADAALQKCAPSCRLWHRRTAGDGKHHNRGQCRADDLPAHSQPPRSRKIDLDSPFCPKHSRVTTQSACQPGDMMPRRGSLGIHAERCSPRA